MKRILLFCFTLLTFSGLLAQSLQLTTTDGKLIQNGELIYHGGSPDEYMAAYVVVTNTGSTALDVLVRKYEIFAANDSSATFCWGLCFPWFVNESPDPITLEPGVPSNDFSADYLPENILGHARVMFTFFDMRNTADSISVYVEFAPSYLGLSDANGSIPAGTWILKEGPHTDIMIHEFAVTNHAAEAKDVQVRRIDNFIVPGADSYFCWGACFPPHVIEMENPVSLMPEQSSEGFSADYNPKSHSGTSTVTYVFYDNHNPADSVWLNISFDGQAAGIGEGSPISLRTWPNPAGNFLNVSLSAGNQDIILALTDLTGRRVMDQAWPVGSEQEVLNVRHLPDGLYFLTIFADGKPLAVKKIILRD